MNCKNKQTNKQTNTTLVRDADNRGGYVYVGIGGIPGPSFQCCYEPRAALKIDFKYREKIVMIDTQ